MDQESTPAAGQEPEATPAEAGQEPSGDQPRTFSEDYVRQLRDEAAANRKRAREAQAKVEEYETANQSEMEKLTGKVTKAEQRATEAEARLLRYEVASEKEVPAKLVPLLTATSREDLEAQADLILENAKPAPADFDGGAREPAPEPKTPEQAHEDFLVGLMTGRQADQ